MFRNDFSLMAKRNYQLRSTMERLSYDMFKLFRIFTQAMLGKIIVHLASIKFLIKSVVDFVRTNFGQTAINQSFFVALFLRGPLIIDQLEFKVERLEYELEFKENPLSQSKLIELIRLCHPDLHQGPLEVLATDVTSGY